MKLDLIYPCRENLNKMPDTATGKFCGPCSKEVVDFTAMSKEEVLNYLSTKKTCGIFRNDQLDKVHEPIVHIRPKKHFVRLAVASLSVFVLSLFGCDDAERDYDRQTNGNESCNKTGVKKGRTTTTTLGAPRPMEVLVGDSIEVGEIEPEPDIPKDNTTTQIKVPVIHKTGEAVVAPPMQGQDFTAGVPVAPDSDREIMVDEQMPDFPGGNIELAKFLKKNIRYPKLEEIIKIEGRVILEFDVLPNGSIDNIVVTRSVSAGIDKEAIRVMKLMPKWTVGLLNGKPTTVAYTLPIQFSLNKD